MLTKLTLNWIITILLNSYITYATVIVTGQLSFITKMSGDKIFVKKMSKNYSHAAKKGTYFATYGRGYNLVYCYVLSSVEWMA
jgi:hypothetical protein